MELVAWWVARRGVGGGWRLLRGAALHREGAMIAMIAILAILAILAIVVA